MRFKDGDLVRSALNHDFIWRVTLNQDQMVLTTAYRVYEEGKVKRLLSGTTGKYRSSLISENNYLYLVNEHGEKLQIPEEPVIDKKENLFHSLFF